MPKLTAAQLRERIFDNPNLHHPGYGFDPSFFFEWTAEWASKKDVKLLCKMLSGDFNKALPSARKFYDFYAKHILANPHCSANFCAHIARCRDAKERVIALEEGMEWEESMRLAFYDLIKDLASANNIPLKLLKPLYG